MVHRTVSTIVGDFPWAIGTVAFSGNGEWLAIGTYSQVTVCDTAKFEKRHVLPIDHWTIDTAISPDGRLVATAGNQGASGQEPGIVKVRDVASGKVRHMLDPQVLSAQRVAFSPDGRLLACSGRAAERDRGEFSVTLWDIEQGKRLGSRREAAFFDFQANGTSLAVAGRGGAWLWQWDGKAMSETLLTDRECREIRFSPDGRRLALLDARGRLSLRFVGESQERPLGPATGGVAFSPDGREIAALGDSTTTIWQTTDGRVLTTIPHAAGLLRFAPDGRTLITAGQEVRLWQTETGRELLNLGTYSLNRVTTMALSPSGTQLAVGGGYRDEHEGVWIWHAPKTHAIDKIAQP